MKQLQAVSENCTDCSLCQKECAFLQQYGKPKAIADAFEPSRKDQQAVAFESAMHPASQPQPKAKTVPPQDPEAR